MTTLVLLADTHTLHGQVTVPDGDVLIHAGDFCGHGTLEEVAAFGRWLRTLPHRHKVVIAGNHDWPFERNRREAERALGDGVIYLQDSEVNVEGLTIYGSPWQPAFCDWAFNLPRNGWELAQRWAKIPTHVDVLVTHGPPFGTLDVPPHKQRVGCEALAAELLRIAPLLHVFGHIHHSYGEADRIAQYPTHYVNASICNERYEPVNAPVSWVYGAVLGGEP